MLHIAPDELTGGAVVLSLFPAALFATWAASGRAGCGASSAGPSTGG